MTKPQQHALAESPGQLVRFLCSSKEHRAMVTSGQYLTKYHSETVVDRNAGEPQYSIVPRPLGAEFPPIEIAATDKEEYWVIAKLVEVLQ